MDDNARSASVDKNVVLFVAAIASFLTPFMGSSINVALPTIGREFSMDAVTLSWVSTAYLLTAAMFLVPLGRFADIKGRRKVFLAGMVGYTVVSFLCTLAVSETMLLAFRALQGFTDAMMFGTSNAIVVSVFPAEQRGRALGVTVASVYAGSATGPFIGGLLTQVLGWRSIFWLTTLLGIIVVVMTQWKMRGEWAEAKGQKMDIIGSVLFGCALLGVMYGFRLLPSINGLWLVLAGAALLLLFVIREARAPSPVLDIGLFRRNVVFALSNLSALINYAATFALSFLMSLFLQYTKGLSPQAAGMVLLAQPVVMACVSPLAGRLSDRVEPRIVASAGMALTAAGLVLLSFLDGATSLALIIGTLMLSGLGFGLFSSPNQSAIMGSVERRHYGVASATTGLMRLVGQMLSMGIAALIIALIVGEVEITPAQYAAFLTAFRMGFRVFATLCGLGILASLARGNVRASNGRASAGGIPGS